MDNSNIVSPAISYIKTRMKRGKIVSVDDTVRVIRDGDTVALDGFLGACVAEELIVGLTNRFRETGEPKNLTLIYASGIGDGKDRRVKTIVNYDNFSIVQELEDDYINMVKYVVYEFYTDVTRYTTSTFLRMKLGDELQRRDMAPHIFQSKEEARQALEKKE